MNQKGQTLVETMLVLPLLLLVFSSLLIIFSMTFAFFYSQYHLHEATFCGLSYPTNYCQKILIKNMTLLKFIKTKSTSIVKTPSQVIGKMTIALNAYDELKSVQFTKTIELVQWK